MPSSPIAFTPLTKERIWGGRRLEAWGKQLPDEVAIGESWEVVDRAEAQSVVAGGPLAGRTLHELWADRRGELFGARAEAAGDRFPLLVKLLDARETLSVQVHPPARVAVELAGEPKTEMWVLADADPGAHLYAGTRAGVTEERFRAALEAGEDVSGLLHRLDVVTGDAMFIPSGRVHAIGAGCLIFEIQQSSDTTYRVFDFNRPGADGELRELHVPQSLASIDFADAEPSLLAGDGERVVACAHFVVSRWLLHGARAATAPGECALFCVLAGEVRCGARTFSRGASFLVPAGDDDLVVDGEGAQVLVVELPEPDGTSPGE